MRTFEGFMHGVNLGGWLSQADETTTEHYETFITEEDIKAIAKMGLDHVRLPVDYTLRRYVKKPGGAKPGFVIYTHQHTLSVEPLRLDPQNPTAGGD